MNEINNSTTNMMSEPINLAVPTVYSIGKASKYNTYKLIGLYKNYEDTLYNIIKNREQYETAITTDPSYSPYIKIIQTYDIAESLRDVDMELHDLLIATCYFQIHSEIIGDDGSCLFVDEVEDGKEDKKPKVDRWKLTDYFIKKYCIISWNDTPYLYIGSQYYMDKKADRLEKDISKMLRDLNYLDKTKVSEITTDIIYRIINLTHKFREYPFNKVSNMVIPVANGVVYRKTMELLPHSPAFAMLYHLNADYNPNVGVKYMIEYLNSLVEIKEDAELLLQIPAQALIQNPYHQLAYTLTGDGKNGKSTYINFLQAFIGKENYTSISLQELTENRFAKAELEGKLLNLYPDLTSSAIKYTGIFKALTGADEIQVERKFAQPFRLQNKAVFCFSANELPTVSDSTWAFWRRWCVIPFPNKFETAPEFLKNLKTKENMSAFLNLVIEKMNRIDLQGLSESDRIEKAMHLWKSRSSSAFSFVSDCIEKDIKSSVTRPALESYYLAYCEEKDLTLQDLKSLLHELHKFGINIQRHRDGSKFVTAYHGISYHKPMEKEKEDIQEELLEA